MTPNNEAKVTERPWKTGPEVPYVKGINLWRGSLYIGNIEGDRSLPDPDETARANAAFIVKAVNAHEELLNTLRFVRQTVHQAHHDGSIEGCRKNTCDAISQVLEKSLAEGRPE